MSALLPQIASFDRALEAIGAARTALEAAQSTDAVLDVRARAEAVRFFARIAKDPTLEIEGAELRFLAERRLGLMIGAQREAGLLSRGAADKAGLSRQTLDAAGIGKTLALKVRQLAQLDEADFAARLARRREDILRGRKRVPLDLFEADKAVRRAEREAALAEKVRALPDRRYGVVLADPEWDYEPRSRETGMDRAAANHYPTSPLAAICARDVASIAAPDCLLALWATVPMLAEAFCVLDAWGFASFVRDPATGFLTLDKSQGRYVSSGVWTKYEPGAGIGMGHWFRVDHEILLIATRGSIPCPAKGDQARSVFDVPASRVHSEKPDLVAEILEGYFPTLPKIELNRRGTARPGWDAWGNEADEAEARAVDEDRDDERRIGGTDLAGGDHVSRYDFADID